MRAEIPTPNPFLTHWLLSKDCSSVIRQSATLVRDVYRSVVAKDSGALAASAQVDMAVGGEKHDRIVADVSAGRGTPHGGYGASHEFGTKRTVEGPQRPDAKGPVSAGGFSAAHDFLKVLSIVDSM